jgi:hypothetical protein
MDFKEHAEQAVMALSVPCLQQGLYYFSDQRQKLPKQYLMIEKNPTDNDLIRATSDFNVMSMHCQWARWGLNTFDPTVSLTAGLILTTPSSEPGPPRFPYHTFFIRIPPGFIPFWREGDTNPQWGEGMIVSRLQTFESDPPEFNIVVSLLGGGSAEKRTGFLIAERTVISPSDYVKTDEDFWNNQPAIVIEEDQESRKAIVKNLSSINPDITIKLSFRLIANLCSWIESKGGMSSQTPSNVHHSKKHNKPGWDSISEKTRISQWILGQEVKLSPELIASAREHVLALATGEKRGGWHLHALHTVRGHITHQPYGPKSSKRKVIWIQPYPKGLKDGDVAAHIYKAKERECAKET